MKTDYPFYKVDYSFVPTKTGDSKTYDLSSPAERKLYFNSKVGDEIEKLKEFFSRDSFIAYLLAPKMAGKGTYVGMFKEIFGSEDIEHLSVGDLVRRNHTEFQNKGKNSDIYKYAKENYRGFLTLDEVFKALVNRDTKTVSIPTEFVLTMIKKEIDLLKGKTIFLDGFPRKIDQISYALYFKELVDHREDKDFFVFVNLPMEMINQRITDRAICPKCQTSRNLKLSPTSKVCYDEKCSSYYLVCDNESCENLRMVCKEGDELGIENIKERIIEDLKLMEQARKMYGVEKIEIYNSLEKQKASEYVDDYELTKEFCFDVDCKKDVKKTTKQFSIMDGSSEYVSLSPAPAMIQLIRQLVLKLNL